MEKLEEVRAKVATDIDKLYNRMKKIEEKPSYKNLPKRSVRAVLLIWDIYRI